MKYVHSYFAIIHCALQIPGVHIVGSLIWFHPEFMRRHLPYMSKVVDKKATDQMLAFRQQYLTARSGQDLTRLALGHER